MGASQLDGVSALHGVAKHLAAFLIMRNILTVLNSVARNNLFIGIHVFVPEKIEGIS